MTHFTMKEKHYLEISKIIKVVHSIPNRVLLRGSERLLGYDKATNEIKNRLNKYFKSENIKFDETKFDKGCGLE